MTVTKKILTEKGLQLTLSDVTTVIDRIYIDRARNYKNAYETDSSKHTFMPSFKQNRDVILIDMPSNTPTFFTVTLFYQEDEQDVAEVVMFVNEFSLFKAKSKYLQVFESDCALCDNIDSCKPCDSKRKRYAMMTYMMRLNLFHQCYKNNNLKGSVKYYIDACRMYDMDKIAWQNMNLDPDYYKVSGNLYTLFDTMNEWIKNNGTPCEKRIIQALLIADLYSLIFDMGSEDSRPKWILEDHIWNMNDEFWFGDGVWKF